MGYFGGSQNQNFPKLLRHPKYPALVYFAFFWKVVESVCSERRLHLLQDLFVCCIASYVPYHYYCRFICCMYFLTYSTLLYDMFVITILHLLHDPAQVVVLAFLAIAYRCYIYIYIAVLSLSLSRYIYREREIHIYIDMYS